MPVLVLWAAASGVGKHVADPLDLWRLRANDIRGEALPTGHYVNEEQPIRCSLGARASFRPQARLANRL